MITTQGIPVPDVLAASEKERLQKAKEMVGQLNNNLLNINPSAKSTELPAGGVQCEDCVKPRNKRVGALYIGCKIIRAEPMDEVTFMQECKGKNVPDDMPTREGYRVLYPDGYESWSPKSTFEEAYRYVSQSEKQFIED